jgi:AraC family transcriptional regulator
VSPADLPTSKELLRQEYVGRINRVIDYIDENIDTELTLETLARVANFSRFHLHRIFSALVGETLNGFVRRLRLEAAASMLIAHPKETITRIALACGFSSSAGFAGSFSEHFGMSASAFRQRRRRHFPAGRLNNSKIGKTESKTGKASLPSPYYIDERNINFKGRFEMKVEVKEMPEMYVAYYRHVGSYSGVGEAFDKLMRWAGPRGLLQFPKTRMLGVYHDDPEITDPSRLRSSACVTVPEGTEVDGEIGAMTVPGGRFAVASFEITHEQFGEAWDELMGKWLPEIRQGEALRGSGFPRSFCSKHPEQSLPVQHGGQAEENQRKADQHIRSGGLISKQKS